MEKELAPQVAETIAQTLENLKNVIPDNWSKNQVASVFSCYLEMFI